MIWHILRDVIFLTLDGATIGTYCGKIFSWASLVHVNSTQTTYEVSRGIRWQFFDFQMKSDLPPLRFSPNVSKFDLSEHGTCKEKIRVCCWIYFCFRSTWKQNHIFSIFWGLNKVWIFSSIIFCFFLFPEIYRCWQGFVAIDLPHVRSDFDPFQCLSSQIGG